MSDLWKILSLAVVLLGTMFIMGGLRPYHPYDSFLLISTPIAVLEIIAFLVLARDPLGGIALGERERTWQQVITTTFCILVMAVMVPTVMILLADQLLDGSPGVEETLPVTQTFESYSDTGNTYYAVVPARTPPAAAVRLVRRAGERHTALRVMAPAHRRAEHDDAEGPPRPVWPAVVRDHQADVIEAE